MSILGSILSAPFGELIGKVGDVIDSIHTSGEEKGQLEIAKLQLQLAARDAERKAHYDLEQLYTKDIENLREQVKVELSSEDPWVRRSRPMFFWTMYAIIGVNYLLPNFTNFAYSVLGYQRQLSPIEIPYELWTVFGGAYLGYAYFRSRYDKQVQK